MAEYNRARAILEELDAKGAPDSAYRAGLSTMSKTPLKRGETWRERLKFLAESTDKRLSSTPAARGSGGGSLRSLEDQLLGGPSLLSRKQRPVM